MPVRNLAVELSAYVLTAPSFDWPRFNCCHFAGTWAAIVEGGPDPMAAFVARHAPGGLPGDAAGVAALVAALGGLPALVSAGLGRAAVAPGLARVGDLVFFGVEGGAGTVGICNGVTAFVPSLAVRIRSISMRRAVLAWRLGS